MTDSKDFWKGTVNNNSPRDFKFDADEVWRVMRKLGEGGADDDFNNRRNHELYMRMMAPRGFSRHINIGDLLEAWAYSGRAPCRGMTKRRKRRVVRNMVRRLIRWQSKLPSDGGIKHSLGYARVVSISEPTTITINP